MPALFYPVHPAAFLGGGVEIRLLVSLFVIFTAAKIAAELCERLRQPAVVGEILAGVVIGPGALNLVQPNDVTGVLAEIGVILLLFVVGLDVNPRTLFQIGRRALVVAVLGVVVPFFAGWGLMHLLGYSRIESVFIGAALVATSVGITARVLAGLNVLSLRTSQLILGAAVIDDVLGLIVLSVANSLAKGGAINYLEISVTAGISIGFVLFVVFFGSKLAVRVRPGIDRLQVNETYFVVGMILCLGLSLAGALVGVAAIIGAFLAGMALSEAAEETSLPTQARTVMEFTVPFFLVGIGLQFDVGVFRDGRITLLAVLLVLTAVVTKLVACGAAAYPGGGRRAALQVGMGMVPRGEVGIIVAQLGLSLGVLSRSLYSVVVTMAVMTTLVAPPFLTRLFRNEPGDAVIPERGDGIVEVDTSVSEIR